MLPQISANDQHPKEVEEKWIQLRQTVLEAIPRVRRTPKLYGTPKIHKNNTLLRPIVSSCGSITYNTAKYLASILTSHVGKNCHSIKNTKELVDKLRGLEIPPARKLVSYDVTALFTSVPVDKALEVITERLHADDTLTSRTEMTIPQIVELLDFCLNTTYPRTSYTMGHTSNTTNKHLVQLWDHPYLH